MAIEERYLTGLNSVYNKGALRNNVGRRIGRTSTISDAPMQGLTTNPLGSFMFDKAPSSSVNDFGLLQQMQNNPTVLASNGSVFTANDVASIPTYKQGQYTDGYNNVPTTSTQNSLPTGQYQNMVGEGTVADLGLGATKDMPKSQWLDGLSNFETLQGAAGLGGLAMNAYGMFGSGGTMDVNKKNIELMNQQIANNQELMATRQARGRDISAAFGPRTGLGA